MGSVTAIPLPAPGESFVTRKQLAEMMGVSVRTIDYWVADGMPSEQWGLAARRFLPSRAVAWARARPPRRGKAA